MPTQRRGHIPLDKCEHGRLYRLSSRNLGFGVFNAPSKGFIGIREKFGHRYLFTEFHHDTGAPFGTAWPLEALDMYPGEVFESQQHNVTAEESAAWAPGDGQDETDRPTVGESFWQSNKELFNWLDAKESEYANRPDPDPGG